MLDQKRGAPTLSEPPLPAFVARLQELGVSPLSVGRTIVATWEPHEKVVLEAIRDLALELHIAFNKGAVMVLPGNVNKAWGLKRALKPLCLSLHNVVGIGFLERLRLRGCRGQCAAFGQSKGGNGGGRSRRGCHRAGASAHRP